MSSDTGAASNELIERMDTPDPMNWADRLARVLQVNNDGESHVERDPEVFHPSQLSKCNRQATISKLGLETHDTQTLGTFFVGTLIHEWLEEEFAGTIPGMHHEIAIETEYEDPSGGDSITITGTADVYDEHRGIVYDFKTRGGWYRFDPPSDRHLDQLTLYMDALEAQAGQVVYLNKKNLEVRTWPETDTFGFDQGRLDSLLGDAREIRDTIRQHGPIAECSQVPFEDCGCWLCDKEN